VVSEGFESFIIELIETAVLPDTTFGKSLDPKNQGQVSTSGFPIMIFNGKEEECQFLVNLLPPRKRKRQSPLTQKQY
jgi:hypothetical protein